jgi:hypothetical protein
MAAGAIVPAEQPSYARTRRLRIAAVQRAYHQSTRVLGLVLMVLGVAVLISTLARGGGAMALGVFVGAGLALFGAARFYLASHTPESRGGP